MTDTINGSLSAVATTVTVDHGTRFKKGDVIEVDSEQMWISGVSTNDLTVTREYSGSAATHTDGSTATIVNQARLEGADADYDRSPSTIAAPYNYTQIFQADVNVSRTDAAVSKYGIANAFDYRAAKAVPGLSRLINKALYVGARKAGTKTTPRAFGGFDELIGNHTAISGALTETNLLAIIEDCWDDGGNPDTIMCNAYQKQKITGFYSGDIRTVVDETRGGCRIDKIITDFGELNVVLDRNCPTTSLYVVESQYIAFISLQPFTQEPLAKTGDGVKGQVVTELTLVIKNVNAHGRLSALSVS